MVNIATWSITFQSGVDEIDRQHQSMFETLDEFFTAAKTGCGVERMRETLEFLEKYSKDHFDSEEAFMARLRYPWQAEHKQQHDYFLAQVRELQEKLAAGEPMVLVSMTKFLIFWLQQHIKSEDLKGYVHFANDDEYRRRVLED